MVVLPRWIFQDLCNLDNKFLLEVLVVHHRVQHLPDQEQLYSLELEKKVKIIR